MKKIVASVALFVAAQSPLEASIIDFENLGAVLGEGGTLTGQEFRGEFGVSFYSNERLQIVEVGAPVFGFEPMDKPRQSGALGQFFLGAGLDDKDVDLVVVYDNPVPELSFDIGDIDGDEVFEIRVYDASGLELDFRRLSFDDLGAGDAEITRIAFSDLEGEISRLVILGTKTNAVLGIAFDNLLYEQSDGRGPCSCGHVFIHNGCAFATRVQQRAKNMRFEMWRSMYLKKNFGPFVTCFVNGGVKLGRRAAQKRDQVCLTCFPKTGPFETGIFHL